MIYAGIDISLRHSATVMRWPGGKVESLVFWPHAAPFQKGDLPSSFFYEVVPSRKESEESLDCYSFRISQWHAREIALFLSRAGKGIPMFVCIENLAFNKLGIDVAKLSTPLVLLRRELWIRGAQVHLVDPMSLKLYAGAGNYSKSQMVRAALKHMYIPEFLMGTKEHCGMDIADAYFLMDIAQAENQARTLGVYPDDLNKTRVLMKKSKRTRLSLVERPYIAKRGAGEGI